MAVGIPVSDAVAVVLSRSFFLSFSLSLYILTNTSKDRRVKKARWRFLTCREAKEMHSVCADAWGVYARADVFHARRWLLSQVRLFLLYCALLSS